MRVTVWAFIYNSGPYYNPDPIVQGLWCSEYGIRVRVTVSSVSRVGINIA